MNSTARRRQIDAQPVYKVRLTDGTMAKFATFSRAAAVAAAIAPAKAYRDDQPGYILLP